MKKHLLKANYFTILPTCIFFYLKMFKYLQDQIGLVHKQLFELKKTCLSINHSSITIKEYEMMKEFNTNFQNSIEESFH